MIETDENSDLLTRYEREMWLLAIGLFVVGDLVTTILGVVSGQVAEAGPLGAPVIRQYGIYGMVALKLGVVSLSYSAWRLVPHPERSGIPLGLASVGLVVTGWNAAVLVSVIW